MGRRIPSFRIALVMEKERVETISQCCRYERKERV
jgi:hypothetical protein